MVQLHERLHWSSKPTDDREGGRRRVRFSCSTATLTPDQLAQGFSADHDGSPESSPSSSRNLSKELAALVEAARGRQFAKRGIYFAEREGLIKIGRSCDAYRRMRDLGVRGTRPLRLLAVGKFNEYPSDVEIVVHNQFAAEHIGHEWFKPSPRLLAFIAEVARTEIIPEHLDRRITSFDSKHRPLKLTGRGPKRKRGVHWTHRRSLDRATRFLIAAQLAHRAMTNIADPSGHSAPTAGGAR